LRLVRQPDVGSVDLGRLLAGVDLHPVDLPLAAVGLRDRRVDDLDHHRRDVESRAVALDVRNDRRVGDGEAVILVDGDLLATGRDLHVLVGHGLSWDIAAKRSGTGRDRHRRERREL
jgi:predicted phosphoribosyltransferase